MRITKLEISGYRSLKEVLWRPGSLNLIVGPNGSGKSNLLRLLELISSAARGKLADAIADSGGMIPILWDHQPGSFSWTLSVDDAHETRPKIVATYEMLLQQAARGSAYRIERDSLILWNEDFAECQNIGYRREKDSVVVRGFLKGQISESQMKDYDENESYMVKLDWDTASQLRAWTIHEDIEIGSGSSMRRPTTTQFVTKLDEGGRNLAPVLHTLYTGNRTFKNLIDEGMRAGFGDEYERLEFQPAAAQQTQLSLQWKSSSEPHAGQDLSDGTLRFLFLLTCLGHPEPPPLIVLEEPDVGLHPSMLSVVAEFAASAAERTQVVITTHSPEFLDAFSDASPAVTVCNWEDGQTHMYTLPTQRLEKWLEQYRLGHLFTSGELDALAQPDVEPVKEDPFEDLAPEDAALAESSAEPVDGEDG